MELSVLIIVHATSVAQACLVVPQTLDLAGENDVIARPHGLETRTFHFKVNVSIRGCASLSPSVLGHQCLQYIPGSGRVRQTWVVRVARDRRWMSLARKRTWRDLRRWDGNLVCLKCALKRNGRQAFSYGGFAVPVRCKEAREKWQQHLCPDLFFLQFFLQALPVPTPFPSIETHFF